VVGGTQAGVGKTTFAVGLMAAFRQRGLRVQVGRGHSTPGGVGFILVTGRRLVAGNTGRHRCDVVSYTWVSSTLHPTRVVASLPGVRLVTVTVISWCLAHNNNVERSANQPRVSDWFTTLHYMAVINWCVTHNENVVSRARPCARGFKVGADLLDPLLHEAATGRASFNLDGWMLSKEYNLACVQRLAGRAWPEGWFDR
jgi:hypothetical protein